MRSYTNLSDTDFEKLVADLLSAKLAIEFKTYARGKDFGVDLRAEDAHGHIHIGQCKHYVGSTASHLRAAAKGEVRHLEALNPLGQTYWFVTSRPLTLELKRQIANDLNPWLQSPEHVLGANDLEDLLDAYPPIERRHVKLWIASWTQLDMAIHSARYRRSQALLEEIGVRLGRYVQPSCFPDALQRLLDQRVLIIAGEPGIGKTTLAHLLLAQAVAEGFEAVEIVSDVDEGWEALVEDRPQIFFYDDFLGRTSLAERLGKNEDSALIRFIRRIVRTPRSRFVLTTREYILQDAQNLHERLAQERLDTRRMLLRLSHYSLLERARIVANHVEAARLPTEARRSLLYWFGHVRCYEAIIEHPNFSPRQIEWLTGLGPHDLSDENLDNFAGFALYALDDPAPLWRFAFENDFSETQQLLILVLGTMPRRAEWHDLACAWEEACDRRNIPTRNRAFEKAVGVVEGTVMVSETSESGTFSTAVSPAVLDFVRAWLLSSPSDARVLIEGAVFFEQVVWLWDALGHWGEAPDRQYLSLFVAAVERTVGEPSCTWRFGVSPVNDEPYAQKVAIPVEHRLATVAGMRAYGVVETEALSEAWKLLLEEARRGWANGEGEPDDILHAAGLLDSLGEYHGTVAEALERRLLGDLTDPAEWEYCADLHEIAPDAFSRERWEALCERLQSLLDDPLCAWSPGSRDDVEERVLKGVSEWHTLNPAGSGRSTRRSLNPPSIAPPPVPQPQPGEDEMIEQVFRRLARLDLESAA